MKIKTSARILAAAGLGAILSLFAPLSAQPAPAQPAAADAGAPELTGVRKELNDLVEKIQARLGTLDAPPTEAQFADELKQFDALFAAHKDEKDAAAAQVLLLKATLYIEIFNDSAKAAGMLKQIKADFPGTEPAGMADGILEFLEKQKAAEARRALLTPGALFPDFTVKDTGGNALSPGNYKGKVVLIDFWATWCEPCVAEIPHVQAAYQKYHDKGFEVIGISLDQDAATLVKYVTGKKMPWPQHWDDGGELAMRYGVMRFPTTFLLDGEGKIVATDLRGPDLEKHLEKLLGKGN
ncbi:MAG: TlpA family protein disulfide reductase [Opitutaceae bacterium]|jgi:peroxiredoxin|nr:TlpA family protein disulfide reductase [Opitutaceae bacterium]